MGADTHTTPADFFASWEKRKRRRRVSRMRADLIDALIGANDDGTARSIEEAQIALRETLYVFGILHRVRMNQKGRKLGH